MKPKRASASQDLDRTVSASRGEYNLPGVKIGKLKFLAIQKKERNMPGDVNFYLDRVRDMASNGSLAGIVVYLNDTYLISDRYLPDGNLSEPSLARVAQLIADLRGIILDHYKEDRVLVVHSGDFLGPSYISRKTGGSHIPAEARPYLAPAREGIMTTQQAHDTGCDPVRASHILTGRIYQ
jgi:hypothetical protein